MTGWGQHGPLASAAGHDINYIALSGALHAIGTAEAGPVPPLNLVGDFGGGALYLAFGMVCALLETQRSGRGQVVDAAMTDGAASLMAMTYALRAAGQWSDRRGVNLLDGGAHFYGTYECADGGWLAVGPIEPRFYRELLERIGLADDETLAPQLDARQWPAMRARLAEVFRQRPRDEWCRLLEGTDACVSPVLSLAEAPEHAHNRARETFVEHRGVVQPAPAPRFSRTPGAIAGPPPLPGQHTREALADWGIDAGRVDSLIDAGAVATLSPGG
jgi:alpha-methylacyl-CoA racemase